LKKVEKHWSRFCQTLNNVSKVLRLKGWKTLYYMLGLDWGKMLFVVLEFDLSCHASSEKFVNSSYVIQRLYLLNDFFLAPSAFPPFSKEKQIFHSFLQFWDEFCTNNKSAPTTIKLCLFVKLQPTNISAPHISWLPFYILSYLCQSY